MATSTPPRSSPAARALALALVSTATPAFLGACADETVVVDEPEASLDGEPLGGSARGVEILQVEANQGTAVFLTSGADPIGPEDRNAYLVSQRDTLVRFQHRILEPEAWVPRELIGRLHIELPGDDEADEIIRERRFFVEADSDPRDITTNFYFSVLADEARVGARFWVELREIDASVDPSELEELSEGVSVAPSEPAEFGFEAVPLEMKVMIVPVDYRGVEPPRFVVPSSEDIELFHDDLLQQNPVQRIDIEVRSEPLVYDETLTNLGSLLGPTRALKIADEAPANVYYHAFVDVGGPSVNMVAGIANFANDSVEESDRRVAATVYYRQMSSGDPETGEPPQSFAPVGSSRTWVHEIGHNQGLRHVYCAGADSAGPDPDYPYEDGKIGVHGFGIRNFHMYTPGAAHDYMSYCGNSWVSDWTWNKTFERIRTLTAWDYGGAPADDNTRPDAASVPVLVGMLFADGEEDWWVYDAPAPRQIDSRYRVELRRNGQTVEVLGAATGLLSDGQTQIVTVALPDGALGQVAGVDELVRVDGEGRRAAISRGAIHDGRAFAGHNREQHRR